MRQILVLGGGAAGLAAALAAAQTGAGAVQVTPVAGYQTGLEICQPAVANGFFRLFNIKSRLVLPPCAAPAPSGKMEPNSSTENISRTRW